MADGKLIERLRAGGILAPETVIAEARRTGLGLHYACALLMKESSGGQNVFGHDPSIFKGAGQVTKEKYLEYLRQRKASGDKRMQGVGPCQLTWHAYQDEADREGGCWRPEINMRVGFRLLAALMRQHGEADGARRYNGTGQAAIDYSRDLLEKARVWQGRLKGLSVPEAPRVLRLGDTGTAVEKLTKRLSYVRQRGKREAYLDGARRRFDAETEGAVRAFQGDHGLTVDGVVGPSTALKLNRAVRLEKARREKARAKKARAKKAGAAAAGAAPTPQPAAKKRARLSALVDRVARLDAQTDEAWTALAAYGQKRRRVVARLEQGGAGGTGGSAPAAAVEGVSEMTAILLRIEARLDALVEIEQRELAAASAPPAPASAEPAGGGGADGGETRSQATVVQAPAPPAPADEGPAPAPVSGNGTGAAPPPEAPRRDLDDLDDEELLRRIARLDRALGRARAILVRRYAEAEAELTRLGLTPKAPAPKGPGKQAPSGGGGKAPAKGKRPAGKGKRPKAADGPPRDRDGAERATISPGNKSWRVRQSKVALARYLKRHRRETSRGLRRKLLTEVRSRKTARQATPTWERAVRQAQAIAGYPVTGEMDDRLQKKLGKLWPSDGALRRIVRATPAWRTARGQLTRNFNVREFDCNDGTPYLDGLVREQGLTKKQAKQRAKQLADRLERVRAREGGRPLKPNSVFRSKAHNARVGGVPGSAHTRGYAADVPPPSGVSLATHRAHMRAVFEGGVGIYPSQGFVHGDFDPNERGDNWTG